MADAEEAGEILGEEDQTEVLDTAKQMIEHAPVIIPQAETNHVDTTEKPLPLDEPTEAAQEEQELAPGEQAPREAGQELTTEEPAARDPGEVEQEFAPEELEQSSAEQQELIPQYLHLEDDQEELLEGGRPGISVPAPSYVETTEDRSQITTDKFMELLASELYDLKKTPLEALESEMKPLPEWMTSATATVKIMLVPEIQMITMAFNIYQTAGNLKQYFATQLKIPESVLQIIFQGRMIEDSETLLSIGVRPHETVQIEMLSLDPENYPIRPIKLQQEYNMPDVITVRVQADANTFQDVAVEIERPTYRKPFLGGFKHRITGVEFHNAGSQTIPKKRPGKGIEVFCQETQTAVERNKQQQTRNTTSTQMTKIGVYVSNMTDKLIKPGKYLTADEYHKHRLDAVVIIQTYLRRWHAINAVRKLREEKRLRLEWEAQEEVRRKKEKEEKLRREHERRLNPKTKEDFELLYHALECKFS